MYSTRTNNSKIRSTSPRRMGRGPGEGTNTRSVSLTRQNIENMRPDLCGFVIRWKHRLVPCDGQSMNRIRPLKHVKTQRGCIGKRKDRDLRRFGSLLNKTARQCSTRCNPSLARVFVFQNCHRPVCSPWEVNPRFHLFQCSCAPVAPSGRQSKNEQKTTN